MMTEMAEKEMEHPVTHVLSRVWRRQDELALEYFSLQATGESLLSSGQITAAMAGAPIFVSYALRCDRNWTTQEAHVRVRSAGKEAVAALVRSSDGLWTVNGEERSDLAGAVDLDVQWTPATNALPINRFRLEVGESRNVDAVWVRLPELVVARLPQTYTRIGERSYRYESNGGSFVADLIVDEHGFVERYADIWVCAGKG